MRASAFEFRFRYLMHAVIYVLGYTAPWDRWLGGSSHWDTVRTWQWLAAWPARRGWVSFNASTIAVLVAAIVFAALGAWLRTWGAAYLGSGVVQDQAMHGDRIVAAGPYRYVRNPLYLGTILHTLAITVLMPPSGAVFAVVAIVVLQLRLIGAEEDFLSAKLGEAYRTYCAKVPRLAPSLWARVEESDVRARWVLGLMGEIYMWGVAAVLAVLGWRYNSLLLLQGVVVAWGVSLVARAFVPKAA